MNSRNRIGLGVATAAVLLAGVWVVKHRAPSAVAETADTEAAPVKVQLVRATLHPMETIVSALGTVVPRQGATSRVAATTSGRLTSVLVREGARIRQGQLLAVLDSRSAKAQENSAAAAIAAASADTRSASLGVVAAQTDAQNTLQQAKLSLQSAIAERSGGIGSARSALVQAESDARKARSATATFDLTNAVSQARLGLQAARAEGQSAEATASNALAQAQTDLNKTTAGTRPQELAQAQSALAQTEATKNRAAIESNRAARLFAKGVFAKRQVDDAQTALQVASDAVTSAQAQLDLLRAGARPEEVKAAQLRVDAAREALASTRKGNSNKIAQAQAALNLAQGGFRQTPVQRAEDLKAALSRVDAAQSALDQAAKTGDSKVAQAEAALTAAQAAGVNVEAKRADAASKQAAESGKVADLRAAQTATAQNEILAPLDGIVTKRLLNPGDIADPSTPIFEVSNPQLVDIMAQLPALDAALVRPGQMARVQSEALPGKTFAARVEDVGVVDTTSGLQSVRLTLLQSVAQLKSGVLTSLEIVVSRRPLALTVPQVAVLNRDGKAVVFTVDKEKATETTVRTGTTQGGLTEVRSGLRQGESVVKLGQYELEDGATVTTSEAGSKAP